jgi:chorismate dehydratase
MTQALTPPIPGRASRTQTLGVVSFLNALPLYHSLLGRAEFRIVPDVPSRLADLLESGGCDVALLPVVDYWRARDQLELVGDGCIASDGETLTVRVYSRIPPDRLTRLHVDGDSHTSVALARVIWRELYGRRLELLPLPDQADPPPEAVLLIGDKVVRSAARGFGFETDLGAAWKHLTGLPFVFAAWYGPRGGDFAGLARELAAARDAGTAAATRIAAEAAESRGWPRETAVEYLGRIMKYRLTPAMHAGMDRFFSLLDEDQGGP